MNLKDDEIKEEVKTYGGFPIKGYGDCWSWAEKKKRWGQQPPNDEVTKQYSGFWVKNHYK